MADEGKDTQWTLTEAEALVIKSVLGSHFSESEEARIRRSGLPRATYQQAKRRLYDMDVLYDRFVPSPKAIGTQRISFFLTRQFPDRIPSTVEWLDHWSGCSLVWSGLQTVFGIVFHNSDSAIKEFQDAVTTRKDLGEVIVHLAARPSSESVPVYFDYEGGWNSFAGLAGTARYPQALPDGEPKESFWHHHRDAPGIAISSLVCRPFEDGRAAHLVGPATLVRSQRRLLERGIVAWRTFLTPAEIPLSDGRKLSQVILTAATLKEGATPLAVFQDLVVTCEVHPFLLASDGSSLLMGTLLRSPIPHETDTRVGGASVMSRLKRHLSGIASVSEQLSQLKTHRLDRYDLLLEP